MSYMGIDHKLKVFISSKCGGKYTIARKSIAKLLDLTGLVETYVFETAPASSEDTQSAYLGYIDESNLCIFLVDNADGVPPAVLSEEKRAKDKHLRLLYLFCDENKKEPTPMQEKIKVSLSQKYVVVHEFSDIVSRAYDSVMQDVITVYKRRAGLSSDENNGVKPANGKAINTETHLLLPTSFSEYPYVARTLTKNLLAMNLFEQEFTETPLERLLSNHLQSVIFQKPFDDASVECICDEVLKKASGEICEVLKLRFQAQKCYYHTKFGECLALLQQAISIAVEEDSIPMWVANDIAIDIRHVHMLIDERNNIFTVKNPGQKFIDESREPVYFPYLDRQVNDMLKKIVEEYFSQLNTPPYSTKCSELEYIFTSLANAFCIAEVHGSIVQTEITRDRLISIYSMLCTLYEDHDFGVEYVKYLIVNRDVKKLDSIIRTHSQLIDTLNGQDIDVILDCVNNMFDPIRKIMSKYLLASRLGYYMNDTTYSVLYNELVNYAIGWVHEDKPILYISEFIFDFFMLNTHRAKGKDIIGFVSEALNRGFKRYYVDCFKLLRHLNLANIEYEDQLVIKQKLIDVILEANEQILNQNYFMAIIHFCKTTEVPYDDLEAVIAEKNPHFYKNTFLLEMSDKRNQNMFDYIKSYLKEEQSRNRTQGDNGTYFEYAHESLDVVYNILKRDGIVLDSELLTSTIDVALETLAAEKQTVGAKLSAVKLLQRLYFSNIEKEGIWDEVSRKMAENRAIYSTGVEMGFLSKETNTVLSFQYDLFIALFCKPIRDQLLEVLYSVDSTDSACIIQLLGIVEAFLDDAGNTFKDEHIIATFLYYSIMMSKNKERDVKIRATNCLIELTNCESTANLALIHLSQIMDTGAQPEKLTILYKIGKIGAKDSSYLQQIINKGKSDTNYLVRYAANRTSQE